MKIGAKMAMLQEKNQKWTLTKSFFLKNPPFFELLKQVPESLHQTGHFGPRQYIGTLTLS